MHKIVTHEDARQMLSDVNDHSQFTTKDGVIIRNLHQLVASLHGMSPDTFRQHVDEEKNDFHRWVNNVIKDNQLADSLLKLKTKKQMLRTIRHRLLQLHKIQHRHLCPYDSRLAHSAGSFSIGIAVGLIIGLLVSGLV